MIIVSGTRAGLVIGLIVTPLKIQHEQSRWNRKFGSGGSSSVDGSASFHANPASWRISALVIPPIRNSATVAGSAVCTHSPAALPRDVNPSRPLAQDVAGDPVFGLGLGQRLGQQLLGLEHLDAPVAH